MGGRGAAEGTQVAKEYLPRRLSPYLPKPNRGTTTPSTHATRTTVSSSFTCTLGPSAPPRPGKEALTSLESLPVPPEDHCPWSMGHLSGQHLQGAAHLCGYLTHTH